MLSKTEEHLKKGLHAIVTMNTPLAYKDECRFLRTRFNNVFPLIGKNQQVSYMIDVKNIEDLDKLQNMYCKSILVVKANFKHKLEVYWYINNLLTIAGELLIQRKPWGNFYRNLQTGEIYKFQENKGAA